jgi:hypothetical protein
MRSTFGCWRADVERAHEHHAFETELGAHRRGRDAVHAGAGLGDDARLAHALGQHDLAQHVVHFVGAGVVEVLALEINLRAHQAGGRLTLKVRGQPLGEIERRRPADIVLQMTVHLALERRIGFGRRIGLLELEDQRHQGLSDEAAAVDAEVPALVGSGAKRIGLLHDGHAITSVEEPGARARGA